MRAVRLAIVGAGLAVAATAEWRSFVPGGIDLSLADGLAGVVLVFGGLALRERRSDSRTGPLMTLAALVWFVGTVNAGASLWHRGPLVHLCASYPTGRLRRWFAGTTVGLAYADGLIGPVADNNVATLGLAALIALGAIDQFVRTSGPNRRAGSVALAAALTYATVLGGGAVARLAGATGDHAIALSYDVVVAFVALLLAVEFLFGRWREATVTDLVVALGQRGGGGTLRDQLARALGDPSLVVGYWIAERGEYVDHVGRPMLLPEPGTGRLVTRVGDAGGQVAVLVHDAATIDDPQLVAAVAAAARLAVSNVRLQAEIRTRLEELGASRRRIVEAADTQRRRLERELSEGTGRRLEKVAFLLDDARLDATPAQVAELAGLEAELRGARSELYEFAQGIRPSALEGGGLASALPILAGRASLPVDLRVGVGRLPPTVEAAVYFVCSEALANVAKHAAARHAWVEVTDAGGIVVATVGDDGVGGVDPARGSGLRGLADRVEALGGRLAVSDTGGRTVVTAAIPVDRTTATPPTHGL